ncbi:MAG: metalloregulator ArsR/SmtB family transcription factor [Dehalococcoidales bacterium]|nr:metalloregulator ArsR/SmtB family transcription factor [Dehalococcoidales bacterium]
MTDEHLAELFKMQAGICKTLADPTRLMILHELKGGELSVGQLTANLGLPQSNVSRHLAVLREGGVVSTRREGTTIYYSLASPRIAEACDLVRGVLEDNLKQNQRLASSLASLRRA